MSASTGWGYTGCLNGVGLQGRCLHGSVAAWASPGCCLDGLGLHRVAASTEGGATLGECLHGVGYTGWVPRRGGASPGRCVDRGWGYTG